MTELILFTVGVGIGACLPPLAAAMTRDGNESRSATTSGTAKGH